MSIRYNYSRQLTPPAPCAYVSISRPDDLGIIVDNVAAQLDTGADMTVVPSSLVERLQLVPLDQLLITGFGGNVRRVPIYLVSLSVHPFAPIMLRVLGGRNEPIVLLGRDVLNRHRVLLDGPNFVLEIGSS